nr:MAG: hypothetical protein BECKSD772E_GA0070983_12233 [Candidatus Kentron sp. SD]
MEHIWKKQNLSLEILKFLQPEELARLSSVNKRFKDLTGKNLLWDVFIDHVYLPTYHHQTEQFHREHIGTIDLSMTVIDIGCLSIKRAGKEEWEGVSKEIYKFIFVTTKVERLKNQRYINGKIDRIRNDKGLRKIMEQTTTKSTPYYTPYQSLPNSPQNGLQEIEPLKQEKIKEIGSNILEQATQQAITQSCKEYQSPEKLRHVIKIQAFIRGDQCRKSLIRQWRTNQFPVPKKRPPKFFIIKEWDTKQENGAFLKIKRGLQQPKNERISQKKEGRINDTSCTDIFKVEAVKIISAIALFFFCIFCMAIYQKYSPDIRRLVHRVKPLQPFAV